MMHPLRIVLALLTAAALGCGGDYSCPTPGATRCFADDRYSHPHGSLYEVCGGGFFDSRSLSWGPEYCYALGDGSGRFNCYASNTVCWSGYCYCSP